MYVKIPLVPNICTWDTVISTSVALPGRLIALFESIPVKVVLFIATLIIDSQSVKVRRCRRAGYILLTINFRFCFAGVKLLGVYRY